MRQTQQSYYFKEHIYVNHSAWRRNLVVFRLGDHIRAFQVRSFHTPASFRRERGPVHLAALIHAHKSQGHKEA